MKKVVFGGGVRGQEKNVTVKKLFLHVPGGRGSEKIMSEYMTQNNSFLEVIIITLFLPSNIYHMEDGREDCEHFGTTD